MLRSWARCEFQMDSSALRTSNRTVSSRRAVVGFGVHAWCSAPSSASLSPPVNRVSIRSTDPLLAEAVHGRRELLTSVTALVVGSSLATSTALAEDCILVDSPSGIQYCDVEEGMGEPAAQGTLIKAHYTGRLASDLKVFDSSYPRGQPLVFEIGAGEVIRGWDMGILGTEGIPPMKTGGKRRLVIPSEFAYGSRGAGRGRIPPNATLIFDVEYLGQG